MGEVNVVLAIDASEHSERALKFYLDYLHKEGQLVHLVHAVENAHSASQRTHHQEQATIIEKKYEDRLAEKQISCQVHSDTAHPGEYICKVSTEVKTMMIVMGTRGMGTLRRTIMGSVSDYVLHHAHCPVAIIRQ